MEMVTTYFRRIYSSLVADVFDIPPRLVAFLLLLILLVLPMTGASSYLLRILISASVLAIFAASWDLLVGRTGQISLGHAFFFGIGAYATALLFKYYGLPLWVTIPLAMLIGVSVALLIGFPCLRVKGPYLALVTMAFPLILSSIVKWSPLLPIFEGEFGIRGLPSFFPLLPIRQQRIAEYYLTLILLVASSVILYKVANSKTGIVLVSILDDEVASKASGINVTKYKLIAFGISGLFASLAGCIQSHLLTVASPPAFALTWSFIPIVVTFIGGIGTIYGPLIGAYIYSIIDKYVLTILIRIPHELEYTKLLIFILVIVILVIKWPRGIVRSVVEDVYDELAEKRELEERRKWIWKRERKKKG